MIHWYSFLCNILQRGFSVHYCGCGRHFSEGDHSDLLKRGELLHFRFRLILCKGIVRYFIQFPQFFASISWFQVVSEWVSGVILFQILKNTIIHSIQSIQSIQFVLGMPTSSKTDEFSEKFQGRGENSPQEAQKRPNRYCHMSRSQGKL